MQLHNLELSNKVLTMDNYEYTSSIPEDLELSSLTVSYFDGLVNKIVPFNVINMYPIIYDKYNEAPNIAVDITVVVCPFTLAAVAFEGKFNATEYVYYSCLVITDGEKTFPIIEPHIDLSSGTEVVQASHKYKRYQIGVQNLRSVFTSYPDSKYIFIKEPTTPVLEMEYYHNTTMLYNYIPPPTQFHPKTLVYLIQYRSSKNNAIKNSIIIGRDATQNNISGYNIKTSGVLKYISDQESKIIQKMGFVTPMLWFAWKSFYPDANIIYLK